MASAPTLQAVLAAVRSYLEATPGLTLRRTPDRYDADALTPRHVDAVSYALTAPSSSVSPHRQGCALTRDELQLEVTVPNQVLQPEAHLDQLLAVEATLIERMTGAGYRISYDGTPFRGVHPSSPEYLLLRLRFVLQVRQVPVGS